MRKNTWDKVWELPNFRLTPLREASMERLLIIAMIFGGAYYFFEKREERRAHLVATRSLSSTPNSCTDKTQCAIVYVTPWCPSCKNLKPQIKLVLEKGANTDPAFGMRVLVGLGQNPDDDKNEAAEYGTFGSVDEGGAIRAAYDIKAYPTVIVVDKEKRVVARGQDAVNMMLARSHPNLPPPQPPAGVPDGALAFPQW